MNAEWKSGPACDATRLLRRRLSVTRLLSLAPAYASIPRSGTCLVFGVCCHVRGAAVGMENGFMRAMSGRTSLAGPAGPGPLPGVSRGVTGCHGLGSAHWGLRARRQLRPCGRGTGSAQPSPRARVCCVCERGPRLVCPAGSGAELRSNPASAPRQLCARGQAAAVFWVLPLTDIFRPLLTLAKLESRL